MKSAQIGGAERAANRQSREVPVLPAAERESPRCHGCGGPSRKTSGTC